MSPHFVGAATADVPWRHQCSHPAASLHPLERLRFAKGFRMQRWLPILFLGLMATQAAQGQGLLVPATKDVAPLAMTSHHVDVTIEDQVAVTKVTQVFHNPTDRALEATYVFPVPRGASVRKFTMYVDNKEVTGELVE